MTQMLNDTNSLTQNPATQLSLSDQSRFRVSIDGCEPVADQFAFERACLKGVHTVINDGDRYTQAIFRTQPDSNEIFTVTVGSDPFDDEAVYIESVTIDTTLSVSRAQFIKRAATLAFVTRLAASIRPTAGDWADWQSERLK